MGTPKDYLMESDAEALRLDMKTDPRLVEIQARWSGVAAGMRIADLGCGSGKTTFILNRLSQPGAETIGGDIAPQRVRFARSNYSAAGLRFCQMDIRQPLEEIGLFDLVWIRFVLEYYRAESFEIVKNIARIVKPGGILCLIDLDHNCLNHFGLPLRLESALKGVMQALEKTAGFDPYVGRKLYAYLYDLGFGDIAVDMAAHHLIYGELKEADAFNWTKKVEVAARNSGYTFAEYEKGFEGFRAEFEREFIKAPRRFTYTPVITCRGRRLV
ncbi:MAG: methyltransferase domain-containing protein [Desulfobacterales bacterium]